jgi:predicted anti-sigma-YlaC factor YlaD
MRSDDPEFIGKFLPGVIEKDEKKLVKTPHDTALALETGSFYVMYANAFVQGPAEMLPVERYEEKESKLAEAKTLYLKGAAVLAQALERKYPGFGRIWSADGENKAAILAQIKADDAPFLYWNAGGTLSAYAINPFDFELGQKIPTLKAMIDRAYALDPNFNMGALDDFYILFYASMPDALGGDKSKVPEHFRLAVEKSGGRLAGPYVSYAQSVTIPAQDYAAFQENLGKALAIDVNKDKDNRLVNTINRRKAQYLLDNAILFFAEAGGETDWIDDGERAEDEEWFDGDEEAVDGEFVYGEHSQRE